MKHWPFNRKQPANDAEMTDALRCADRALTDAQSLRFRADGVGERMRETGRRNHFGEAVTAAIGGA